MVSKNVRLLCLFPFLFGYIYILLLGPHQKWPGSFTATDARWGKVCPKKHIFCNFSSVHLWIPETKAKIICLGASNQVFRRKWYHFGPTRSMNICSTFVQIHREIATWDPTQNIGYNPTIMIRVPILSFH